MLQARRLVYGVAILRSQSRAMVPMTVRPFPSFASYTRFSALSTAPGPGNTDNSPSKPGDPKPESKPAVVNADLSPQKKVATWSKKMWEMVKNEAYHYWIGSRLLVSNIKISSQLLAKSLGGVTLSRREDRLLKQTMTDLLRLIPFSAFVIIPFLELTLPFFLKFFPGLLPSTFETKNQKEEAAKKRLKVKLKMAEILQESINDMAQELQSRNVPGSASAAELAHFMAKVRNGELVNNAYIMRFSKLFTDQFTLDNLSRSQLVAMCKYMNLPPFGTSMMLRLGLERKLREIRTDDKDIAWEGVASLTLEELQTACITRGMRPHQDREPMEKQLEEWLELSKQSVPTSLLIMSRIFMITGSEKPESGLATAMVSLPDDVVEEMVMNKRMSAADKTLSNVERLQYFLDQMEKIREEKEEEEEDITASGRKSGVTTEKQIEAVCHAILTLSSQSSFSLEMSVLHELKDSLAIQEVPAEEQTGRKTAVDGNKKFVKKLLGNIEAEISRAAKVTTGEATVNTEPSGGVVDEHELKQAMALLNDHPNPLLVRKLLRKFDPDMDGKIKLRDVENVLHRLEMGATADELLSEIDATPTAP